MLEKDISHLLRGDTVGICSLLGLRHDFLDSLDEILPEHRDHFTLQPRSQGLSSYRLERARRDPGNEVVYTLRLDGNNYESLSFPDKKSLSKGLLSAIGFDPMSSADETIMARAERTEHHIEACEVAQILSEMSSSTIFICILWLKGFLFKALTF